MMASWIDNLNLDVTPWFQMLCRSSWQIGLYVLIVFAICRAFPKIPGSVRCALWWLACLKLLIGMLWIAPIDLPVLPPVSSFHPAAKTVPQSSAAWVEPFHLLAIPAIKPASRLAAAEVSGDPMANSAPATHAVLPWTLILVAAWCVGLIWRIAVLAKQFAAARRLAGASRYIEGTWVRDTGERLARRIGLSYIPPIRTSSDVSSPVVVGLREPLILIPADGVYSCDNDSLRMALAHEMAHVRRNDLWLGLVPTLAQALFFFHPMAWLASREYSLAREEACDAEAIRLTGIAPHEYGRLLLKFGVAGRVSGAVVGMGASTNAGLLKRRLEMLRHATLLSRKTRICLLVFVAIASLGVLPIRLIAKEAAVTRHASATQRPVDTILAESDPVGYIFSQHDSMPGGTKPADAYSVSPNSVPIPDPAPTPSPALAPPSAPTVTPLPPVVAPRPPALAVPPSPAAPKTACSSEDTTGNDSTDAADDVSDSKDDNDDSDHDLSNVVGDAVSDAVNQAMVTVNSTLNHLQILQDPDTKGTVSSDKVKEQIKKAEKGQSVNSQEIELQVRQSAIVALSQSLKSLESEQKDYRQDLKQLHDQYPSTESQGALHDYMLSQQIRKQALDQAIKSIRRSLEQMHGECESSKPEAKSSANLDIKTRYPDIASADSRILQLHGSGLGEVPWSSESTQSDAYEGAVQVSPGLTIEDATGINNTTQIIVTVNS